MKRAKKKEKQKNRKKNKGRAETYIFRRLSDGKIVEVKMTFDELFKRQDSLRRIVLDDGEEAVRDVQAEFDRAGIGRASKVRTRAKWPIYSEAAGVSPEQIPEAKAQLAKLGVKMEYTPDGRAIFTGPKHRQRYGRATGTIDRDGGYGDP